ncbi:MAG: ribonuclease HI [Thermosynechococcaceae cyanobacterium]
MPSVKSLYTDGACSGNPGPGGWGVVIYFDNGSCQELGGPSTETTNNRMELQAAISGLEFLHTLSPQSIIPLYTDSEYVKKGVTQWVTGWKRKGWKTAKGSPVLNKDLWQVLDALNESWIDWRYVKGHSGNVGNDRCDEIARAFSLGQMPPLAQMNDSLSAVAPVSEFLGNDKSRAIDNLPPLSKEEEQSLQSTLQRLQFADAVASQGYLISTEELAMLLNLPAEEIKDRDQPWAWRNWKILPSKGEQGLPLWQLTSK